MKRPAFHSVLFLIICSGMSLSFPSHGKQGASYYPDATWRISTPEEQGVDSRRIVEMFRKIQSSTLDFHSMLFIRHGYLITEAYWAPYHRNTLHNLKSASKNILSALVGIALEKHVLNNVHQKVSAFFPEYVTHPLQPDISLYHLLTMTAGFNWMEDSGPSPYDLTNWNRIPMRDKPGERFEYNTTLVHMMSAILTKGSGESTKDFADSTLFTPLGITRYRWTRGDDGYYRGGSDIFLTPRDMAKFGYLFLNNGRWNRQQIVPEKWVRESTSRKVTIPSDVTYAAGLAYGYWWWRQEKGYMAWGAGGQYIIVRTDLDMVVVITANGFDNINRYGQFMKSFLEENIYSAVTSSSPLPPDPPALRQLDSTLLKTEDPGESPVRLMPETAATISHNNYIFEPNSTGFTSTSLTFGNNGACSWTYSLRGRKVALRVGLKGVYVMNTTDFSMGVNPDSEEIACKGRWKNDDTFVIEHHIMSDPSKQLFELHFVRQTVTLHIATIGMDTILKGTIEK